MKTKHKVCEADYAHLVPEKYPDSSTGKDDGSGIILLTGAGASDCFGLATLDALLDRSSTPLGKPDAAQLIMETRRSIESQRGTSAIFEDLIARLRFFVSAISTLRSDPAISSRAGTLPWEITTCNLEHRLWEALTICYRQLLIEYGPNKIDPAKDAVSSTMKMLENLAIFNGGALHLFTTNYDCSYQVLAAHCQNLCFRTHIDPGTGDFSAGWFSSPFFQQHDGVPNVYVNRLHGCVAWFNDDRLPYRVYEVFGAGGGLEIQDDNLLHKMCIKLVSSEEIGSTAAFLAAFQEFQERLVSAKCLLIWGSSFRDREVLRAINSSYYSRKTPLPILYINPFLPESAAINNIRETLRGVPVKIAEEFRPIQVRWLSRETGEKLAEVTMKKIREVLCHDAASQ
jgi:hypothetical protein